MTKIRIFIEMIFRYFITIIISLISIQILSQEYQIEVLFNDGLVTYVDNQKNLNFSISFPGDTLIATEIENGYMIDSSMYQMLTFDIPERKLVDKYNARKERKLLEYFMHYEFDYNKNKVFVEDIKLEYENFNNSNGKQFLLWYFKMPESYLGESFSYKENDTTEVIDYFVHYQLYMTFVSNNYVVQVQSPIYDTDSLYDKIQLLKEISNSVRIYVGSIVINALDEQIRHELENKLFIVRDSSYGVSCTIPYWLNMIESKYYLFSNFPDINNVLNTFSLVYVDKDRYSSFLDMKYFMLSGDNVLKYATLSSPNERLHRFYVRNQASYGIFECQFIFFECDDTYGFINYTATKDTYEKNLEKLEEFLNGIDFFEP